MLMMRESEKKGEEGGRERKRNGWEGEREEEDETERKGEKETGERERDWGTDEREGNASLLESFQCSKWLYEVAAF